VLWIHHRAQRAQRRLDGEQHTHEFPAVLCVLCASVVNRQA
jgi:hypothetical protein